MIRVLPAVNIVLGLVGFSWLVLRSSRRWDEYPIEVRKLLALAIALFFGLLSTSVEMFVKSNQLTSSALVISFVKVAALYVLWTTRETKYRTGTRSSTGNPGENQDRDI